MSRHGLRGKVVRGALVKLLGGLPTQLLGLGITLLCFRVLLPEAYGEFQLAAAIYGFSDIFTNPSVGTYLIKNPEAEDATFDVAFTLSAVRAVVLTPLLWLLAPYLTTAFDGQASTTEMLRWLSFGFLIQGWRNLHVIRFHHRLEMGRVVILEAGGPALGNLMSMGLLWWWREPTALIAGNLAGHAINTVNTWWMGPRRAALRFHLAETVRIWRFTRYLLANSLIIFALLNLDDLMVAKLAGGAALGLYAMSYKLVNATVLFVVKPLHEVVLPALALLKHDRRRLTEAALTTLSAFAAISWLICGSIWPQADAVFAVVGGGRGWVGATPIFRAMLPFVLIRGINGAMGSLLLAADRPQWLTAISGSQLALLLPAGWLGFQLYGFLGLTVAITVLNGGAMVALMSCCPRHLEAGAGRLFAVALMPAVAAVAAVAVGYGVRELVSSNLARLFLGVATSIGVGWSVWEAMCALPLGPRLRRVSAFEFRRHVQSGQLSPEQDA
ncbi:MAG: oligosaccharide flippase family protein [Myxococcota bacterium]